MSQNQDEVKRYVVWIGPNDEVAMSCVKFKDEAEAFGYERGMSDAHGWDCGITYETAAEAVAMVTRAKQKFESQREARLKRHDHNNETRP